MPEIKAGRGGSSGGRSSGNGSRREERRRARTRQHLIVGVLVLLIGASAGVVVAWWARQDAEPASVSAATATTGATDATAPKQAPAATVAPLAGALPAASGAAVAMAQRTAAPPAAAANTATAVLRQLDVPELLRERSTAASGWRLARLRGNPAVMVLEFPSLAEQGAAMNRIAALIEKAGAPRDRVLSDTELHQLIIGAGDNAETFYQGHDYIAEHIARFFSLAQKQGQGMNVHEAKLRQLLLDKKVLAQDGQQYVAQGLQAIVTFTAPQPDDPRTPQDEEVDDRRRESVLMHEISHGLYFTSREYREHCWRFWRERISEDERRLFRRLLARMNYDPTNEDLLVNEMQALLMHTPDTRAFGSKVLGVSDKQLADLRTRFRKGMPAN